MKFRISFTYRRSKVVFIYEFVSPRHVQLFFPALHFYITLKHRAKMIFRRLSNFFGRKLPFLLVICLVVVVGYVDPVKMSCKSLRKSNLLQERGALYFTNTWAVRILGGVRKAKNVAKRIGYKFHKKISEGLADIYLFEDAKYPKVTNFSGESVTRYLNRHPKITWAEQQIAEIRKSRWYRVHRTRRTLVNSAELNWENVTEAYTCLDSGDPNSVEKSALNLNDKYWPKQYYLKNCGKAFDDLPGDLNIAPVWVKHRLFGKNIKVVVVDDGVETKHLELVDNYDPALGLDLEDNDRTPDPPHYWWYPSYNFSHGTRCAGVIAMKGNNSLCGVGIAPSVTLGAVRLLGFHPLTDYKISTAFLFNHIGVHIMSNSWGALDDGKWMPYLGPLTRAALKTGITEGRGGRGIIYVFAAGNGKRLGDHCGSDALVSSMYTISVVSCDHRGMTTHFSEQCASVMVTTYSGTRENFHKVISSDIGGDKCTTEHDGTSASAPMVSGAIALALEANRKLSWRDIQHLLVWTSQVAPLQYNLPGTWTKNGAGFYTSHDFGFGMLDINKLIENAKVFQSVGPMNSCTARVHLNEDGMSFTDRVEVAVTTDGCEGTPSEVAYLEHVQLTVSVGYPKRGDLQIVLLSPAGTNAILLDRRPRDSYACGMRSWTFDSVMTWAESAKGKWTIYINGKKVKDSTVRTKSSKRKMWLAIKPDKGGPVCFPCGDDAPADSKSVGEVNDLTLTFYGTKEKPSHYEAGPRSYDDFELLI